MFKVYHCTLSIYLNIFANYAEAKIAKYHVLFRFGRSGKLIQVSQAYAIKMYCNTCFLEYNASLMLVCG